LIALGKLMSNLVQVVILDPLDTCNACDKYCFKVKAFYTFGERVSLVVQETDV
jgi:hypothetical protein